MKRSKTTKKQPPQFLPWPGEELLHLEAFARVRLSKLKEERVGHTCSHIGPIELKHRCKEWADIAHWLKLTRERFIRALEMDDGDPRGMDKVVERLRPQAAEQAFGWMNELVTCK